MINPRRAIHWILDWDGTLTRRDTLDALVGIAVAFNGNAHVPDAWDRLVGAYLADWDATMTALCPHSRLPTNMADERRLLQQLQDVEQRSVERVSCSRIFERLSAETIQTGAAAAVGSGRVQLRHGCDDFFALVRGRHLDQVDILSVNWSRCWIWGCLNAALSKRASLTDVLSFENIHSNELQNISIRDPSQPSSGLLAAEGEPNILSSPDKLARLHGMRFIDPDTGILAPVVYIGDSWTDLECLLDADLGICIRHVPMTSTQKTLQDALERLGIACPHVSDCNQVDDPAVVWVRDFVEVKEWMQKITRLEM